MGSGNWGKGHALVFAPRLHALGRASVDVLLALAFGFQQLWKDKKPRKRKDIPQIGRDVMNWRVAKYTSLNDATKYFSKNLIFLHFAVLEVAFELPDPLGVVLVPCRLLHLLGLLRGPGVARRLGAVAPKASGAFLPARFHLWSMQFERSGAVPCWGCVSSNNKKKKKRKKNIAPSPISLWWDEIKVKVGEKKKTACLFCHPLVWIKMDCIWNYKYC